MAYKALYREWRPKTFDEVVGQEHITVTLKNQISNERIAHAYLFCGTRGTGKTSTAKILSKAVNCLNLKDGEPCNECEMCKKISANNCIDVIELDAASHRGIDKMRDIIEDVQYPPREAKYKVYIIDEVHMLTMEAVNAFLKTLEEPPKNVIFILATTDPQKLPITILSRCQEFNFRRIKSEDIFLRLRLILDKQSIFADDKSLKLISRMCDGAMRDALSILDQAVSMGNGKVQYDNIVNMLGLVTNEDIIKLMDAVIDKNIEKAMTTVDDIVLNGKDIYNFIKDTTIHIRNIMMIKVSNNAEEVIDLSSENIKVIKNQAERLRLEELMRYIRILQEAGEGTKRSKQGRIYLELAIIKMCKSEYDTSQETILSRINQLEKGITINPMVNNPPQNTGNLNKVKERKDKIEKIINEDEVNLHSDLTMEEVQKHWADILEMIKARRQMVVYACLINGKINRCINGIIIIKFQSNYAFSKKRLETEEYRKFVNDVFSDVFNEKLVVKYDIEESKDEGTKRDTEKQLREEFGEDIVQTVD